MGTKYASSVVGLGFCIVQVDLREEERGTLVGQVDYLTWEDRAERRGENSKLAVACGTTALESWMKADHA